MDPRAKCTTGCRYGLDVVLFYPRARFAVDRSSALLLRNLMASRRKATGGPCASAGFRAVLDATWNVQLLPHHTCWTHSAQRMATSAFGGNGGPAGVPWCAGDRAPAGARGGAESSGRPTDA